MLKLQAINQALKTPETKRALNQTLFTVVAKKYAWATQCLSFGRDKAWKNDLVQQLPHLIKPVCVDLACGTGDICALLAARYPQGEIMGVDITPAMLAIAQSKHPLKSVQWTEGDMANPPVADGSVDIITGGYALRNAADLDPLLQMIWHKLKPGGVASFLDFSKNDEINLQRWQMRLLKLWTGFWGILFHLNPAIYNYIPASLNKFPTQKQLQKKIERIGFVHYSNQSYLFGFVATIYFRKPIGTD